MLPRTQPYSFANTGDTSAGLFQDISTRSLQSVRVGESAGAISSGSANAFIGYQAGMQSKQGNYTTAIGFQAAAFSTNTSYSTIIGAYSGAQLSSGNELVFIGYRAGELSGNVSQNVGVGAYALRENTTGNATVAVGYRAGERTLDGGYNTIIGAMAGQDNRSGNFNTIAGYQSGRSAFLGNENTYFGAYAGYSNAFGSANTLIGTRSGELLYNGSYNIFIGYKSGQNFQFGDYNIAIGPFSMQNASSGSSNVIIGSGAGISGSSNNESVIIGTGAGSNASIARSVVLGTDALAQDQNANSMVVIGYQAAQNTLSGSSNTFIGAQTAQNLQSGDYNVTIGANTLKYATTASSNVIIGNAAGLYSKSNIGSVVIGTGAASNANLIKSIIIGTETAENANTTASVIIGYKSAKNLVDGDSNILIGNGADVFKPYTTNAISISSSNTVSGTNSISIGTNLQNERYNSVLLGKNLVTDADQTVIIGNDINIASILYFKDPLIYNLKDSVIVDATTKLNATKIEYQDTLIRPDGTVLDTANLGMYTINNENSFTNKFNRLNSNITSDILFQIPSISNIAIVPDILVPIRTTNEINNVSADLINSFTPQNQIPLVNIPNYYGDTLSVSYNFEVPKVIYNADGVSKNLLTVQPFEGIWATHIETSNSYINFNDSKVSIYGNLYVCGNISSPSTIYNSDGTEAFTYSQTSNLKDAFIIKYDKNGNVIWYTVSTSYGNDSFNTLSIDTLENVYSIGYTRSNLISDQFSNSPIYIYNSNMISSNILNLTNKSQSAIIVKYNTNGILQWANSISTNTKDFGKAIELINHNIYGNHLYITCDSGNVPGSDITSIKINNINSSNNYSNTIVFTSNITPINSLSTFFNLRITNGLVRSNNYIITRNVSSEPSISAESILGNNSNIYSIYSTENANTDVPVYISYPLSSTTSNTIAIATNGPGILIVSYNSYLSYEWNTMISHSIYDNTIIAFISKDSYDTNIVIVGNYKSGIIFYNRDGSVGYTLQNPSINVDGNISQYVYIAKYTSDGICRWVTYITSDYTTINDVHISLYDSIFITGTFKNILNVYNSDGRISPISLTNINGSYLIEYSTTGFGHFGTNISKNGVNNITCAIYGPYLYLTGSYSSQFSIYDPDGKLNELYYLETNPEYPNLFAIKYKIVDNSLQYIFPSLNTEYITYRDNYTYFIDFHLQYQNTLENSAINNSLIIPEITSNQPWTISFWYNTVSYNLSNAILFISPNADILYINSSNVLFTGSNNTGLINNIPSTTSTTSNIPYTLSLNTWYNFAFTGGNSTSNTYIYINGIYVYQYVNTVITSEFLFDNSNQYNTAIGKCQNIIGWSRILSYNEIYTLYDLGQNYVPNMENSIYSNISFIYDFELINNTASIVNTITNVPDSNAVFIGSSNTYTISITNNLPVVNLRNFNISNTLLTINFPKKITPLKSVGNSLNVINLNDNAVIQQSISLNSTLFSFNIDTSGTTVDSNNGVYIPYSFSNNVVTTLPKYGSLSKYTFTPSESITYTQDIEYAFARNDTFVINTISYLIDANSNVYGIPSTSNFTINVNLNTSKLLTTNSIYLKPSTSRELNRNDIVVIQGPDKSYIPDKYIFAIPYSNISSTINGIDSQITIGLSNYVSTSNSFVNTSNVSFIVGESNITSNIYFYSQTHTRYYNTSNELQYIIDLPIIELSKPSLFSIIKTKNSTNNINYIVINSGAGAYLIDNLSNPTLTVTRGLTYTFTINASGHPFWIQTTSGSYNSNMVYSSNITNNGTQVGIITWNVSFDSPNTLYYVCQNHSVMNGAINVINNSSNINISSNIIAKYILHSNIDDKLLYNINTISNLPIITYSDIKNNKISIQSSSTAIQNVQFYIYRTIEELSSNQFIPYKFDTNGKPIPLAAVFQVFSTNTYTNILNLTESQLQQGYSINISQISSITYLNANIAYSKIYIYTPPLYGRISLSNIVLSNGNLNTIYYYPISQQFKSDFVELIVFDSSNQYEKITCTFNANNSIRTQPLGITTPSLLGNIWYQSNQYSNTILSANIGAELNYTSNIIRYSILQDKYYNIDSKDLIYTSNYGLIINNVITTDYILNITSNPFIINGTASNTYNYYIQYSGSNIYNVYTPITPYHLYNAFSNTQYTNISEPIIYNDYGYNTINIIKKNVGYVNQWYQNDINNNSIYVYSSNVVFQNNNILPKYTIDLTFTALSQFIKYKLDIYSQSNIYNLSNINYYQSNNIIYKNSVISYSQNNPYYFSLSNIFINDCTDMISSNIISDYNNIVNVTITSIQNGTILNSNILPLEYTTLSNIPFSEILNNSKGFYTTPYTTTVDTFKYFYIFNNDTCSPIYTNSIYIEHIPQSYGQSFTNGITNKTNSLSSNNFYHSYYGYIASEIVISTISIPDGITFKNVATNTIINSVNTFTMQDVVNNNIKINFNTNILTNFANDVFEYNIKIGLTTFYNFRFPIATYLYNAFINNKFVNINNTSITIQKFLDYQTILHGPLWESLINLYTQDEKVLNDDIIIVIADNSSLNGFLYNKDQSSSMLTALPLSAFINNIIRYVSFNPTINQIINEILPIYIYYKGTLSPQYTIKLNNYISRLLNNTGINITTLSDSSRTIISPPLSGGLINDGYIWTVPDIIIPQRFSYSNVLSSSNLIWSLSNINTNSFSNYQVSYNYYSLNHPIQIIQPIYLTSNIIITTSNTSNYIIRSNIYYVQEVSGIETIDTSNISYTNISNYNLVTTINSNTSSSNILRLPPNSMSSNVSILNAVYGQGTYTVYASSEATNKKAFYAFDYISSVNTSTWEVSPGLYNIVQGIPYSGSNYTLVNGTVVSGEYIELILPQNYILKQYSISLLPISVQTGLRNPSAWYLLGSTTNLINSWNIVDIRGYNGDILSPINQQYTTNILGLFYISGATPYKYYRLLITAIGNNPGQLSTTDNTPSITELQLYYDPNPWIIYPSIEFELYTFNQFTFTNMNATGRYGPLSGTQYAYGPWGTNLSLFYVINGIQYWVVPRTGIYTITLAGAGVGPRRLQNNTNFTAYGAVIRVQYSLQQGHIIQFLIGQSGITPSTGAGGSGGSGGTYMYNQTTNTILFVAGGAGGIGWDYSTSARADASLTTTAKSADGIGGTNGTGGKTAADRSDFMDGLGGAAGGGFISGTSGNGSVNGFSSDPTNGGQSFLNGGIGGSLPVGNSAIGGFGGGGAAGGDGGSGAGGGGGGYSGGGSGQHGGNGNSGGGGGSYWLNTVTPISTAVTNSGMGYINMQLVTPYSVDKNSNISYTFIASSSNYSSNAYNAFDNDISTSWTSLTSGTSSSSTLTSVRHTFTRKIDDNNASVLFNTADTTQMAAYTQLLQKRQFTITSYTNLSGISDTTNSGAYAGITFTCTNGISTPDPDYLDNTGAYKWMNYTTSSPPVAYFKEQHNLSYRFTTLPGYNTDGSYNGSVQTGYLAQSEVSTTDPDLYSFQNATFATGGLTGRTGPTLTQAKNSLLGTPSPSTWYGSYFQMDSIQGIQKWTVPQTATYSITCAGAQGGTSYTIKGRGAVISFNVTLNRNDVLYIVVGQTGTGTGGGGASWVFYNNKSTLLCVAGGGGGGGYNAYNGPGGDLTTGLDASFTTIAVNGQNAGQGSGSGAAGINLNGGNAGTGGLGNAQSGGGGIGGNAYYTPGNDHGGADAPGGGGGGALNTDTSTFIGGTSYYCDGGFGGGGAGGGSYWGTGGGGGGGYNGGGGGGGAANYNLWGGGGGGGSSFSTNVITTSGYNTGSGYIIITKNPLTYINGEWVEVVASSPLSIIGYELTPKITLNTSLTTSFNLTGSTSSSAWITSLTIGSFTLPANFAQFTSFNITVNYVKPLTSYGLDSINAVIFDGTVNSVVNNQGGGSIAYTGGSGSLSFTYTPDGIEYIAGNTYQIVINWWSPGAQFSSISWSLTSAYYSSRSFNYIQLPKLLYILGSNINNPYWYLIDNKSISTSINYPTSYILQNKTQQYTNYRFIATSNNIYTNNVNVSIGKIQLLNTTLYGESNYINISSSSIITSNITSNLIITVTSNISVTRSVSSNITVQQKTNYTSNLITSLIKTSNIVSTQINKVVFDVHLGTNVSLRILLRNYTKYDIDNLQNIFLYIEQNPAFGIIQNTFTGKAVSKCSYFDILNDYIVYQNLGYYGETYIDPTIFYTDTIKVSFSTTPYDLTSDTILVQFNIIPVPIITKNLDTYIFASNIPSAINTTYSINSADILTNTNTNNKNIFITTIDTFQNLTTQQNINGISIQNILPIGNSNTFILTPSLFTQSKFPFTLGFDYTILNEYVTNINNSNSTALTLIQNSLGNIPIYKDSLMTYHKIHFNEYIDQNTIYPKLYDGTDIISWSNQINIESIRYSFSPYFAADLIKNELYTSIFTFEINPSMYFQEQNVDFLVSYKFSINFLDINNNQIERFQFRQNSLTACILSTKNLTYPPITPLKFNTWNTISLINNDPNYNYSNVTLIINNLPIQIDPAIKAFNLKDINSIQFIAQITNPDEQYNFVPSYFITKYLNTYDTIQAQYNLINSHTDIYIRNFIININTNSITTSNIANSNITNVILGKNISVKGLNNICIGNEFSTSGQNSIILGNQIGISETTNEIYESIVIGNQSFTNTLIRNITSIGNNNLNNLNTANQNKVLSFLRNKPIVIGNDIDSSKIDYHINVGNAFLKTNYNNTNQIYLGNTSEIVGIGYLSNVELSTNYQLQVNGSVTFSGDINYSGTLLENGIPSETVLSGANLIPSSVNSPIITQWLRRTIKLFNPYNITSYWSSPIEFTPLPAKLFINPLTSINTNGAYMGSIYTADNRVLFIPLSSTYLGIFNPTINLFSSIPGFPGNNAYNGGILAPDGRVIFVPANTSNIGIFTPSTNTYSTITPILPSIALSGNQYRGGVLLPNKQLLFSPYNSTSIGLFDLNLINNIVYNYGYSIITPKDPLITGNGIYNGCVLIPDGRVIFVPANSKLIGIYNYTSSLNNGFSVVNIKNTGNYSGGVLLSDGRVLFVPSSGKIIGIFNPTSVTINNSLPGYSTITPSTPSLNGQFTGGVLLPDGNVLFIPSGNSSTNSIVTIFNTNDNTISTVLSTFDMVGNDYYGGTLLKDGRVVCVPYFNTNIGILSGYNTSTHQELCMHPMFNKL